MNNQRPSTLGEYLGFKLNPRENSLLNNLLRIPQKDTEDETPHTNNPTKNGSHQADLLYLPEDKGYRYALVVVDIATGLTDATPLKERTADVVLKALKSIYRNGKYLKQPKYIEVDAGKEFRSDFENYYNNRVHLRRKVGGRHRQQSVVEARNSVIGRLIHKKQLAKEILSKVESKEWINFLPQLIEGINLYHSHPPRHVDGSLPFRGGKEVVVSDGKKKPITTKQIDILPMGTIVRTQLDNPKDYLTNARLHGKFRVGDVRWEKEAKPITRIFLRPDQPPMYQVGGNENVAYTRNQLQKVRRNEVLPNGGRQERRVVIAVLGKSKKNNLVHYLVRFDDGSENDVSRKTLIQEVPELIRDFERTQRGQ